MMKPLYLTYSNGGQPYHDMAEKLCTQIKELDAGDYFHIILDGPGYNRDFFAETMALLYEKITKEIEYRPIIYLDSDHELLKPIQDIFQKDWDIAAVYRSEDKNASGRQDFCAGMVMLNCHRPNTARRFWLEWIYKTIGWKACLGHKCPHGLKEKGWLTTWLSDQSAFNSIVIPKEKSIAFNKIYETGGYRILPLHWREYSKGGYLFHYKGVKRKEKMCKE